jgi:FkbM family methyltransferase
VRRRLQWYWNIIGVKYQNNRTIGKLIETIGNRIRLEGMTFSVESPVIETHRKGTLLFGLHEAAERSLLNRCLPPDLPVIELGGGIGVVACLANRKLVRPEQHIVVEANPNLIPLLERNRDLNGCQFKIVNKALGYGTESLELRMDSNFLSGRVEDNTGSDVCGPLVSVPATSLKAVIDESGFDQLSLICDIEGAETTLVEREINVIGQHVRCFFVEVHPQLTGAEAVARTIERLQAVGFTRREENGSNLLLERP